MPTQRDQVELEGSDLEARVQQDIERSSSIEQNKKKRPASTSLEEASRRSKMSAISNCQTVRGFRSRMDLDHCDKRL